MSTKDSTDLYAIATTMDVDPEINYFGWRLNVEDVAAGAATLIEPTGLLTTVMSDAQWDAYPDNITITPAQGNTRATNYHHRNTPDRTEAQDHRHRDDRATDSSRQIWQ